MPTAVYLEGIMASVQRWVVPIELRLAGVATGGTTTTLTDSVALASGGARGSIYEFAWLAIFLDPTLYSRRVIEGGDNKSAGTLTFAPAAGTGPTSGTHYQVWTVPPYTAQAAIDTAERRMEFVEEVPLTLVDGQLQYTLATDAPWVTRPEQILDVVRQYGNTTNEYRYEPLMGWSFRRDEQTFTIDLPRAFNTNDTLILRSLRSFGNLDGTITDTNWLSSAPLDWVAAETALVLAEEGHATLGDQALMQLSTLARRYRRQFAPRTPRPMFEREAYAAGPRGVWPASRGWW